MRSRQKELNFHIDVVTAWMRPLVLLADRSGMDLKEIHALLDRVYVQALKQEGLSLTQIAERAGKTRRSISSVAGYLRKNGFGHSNQISLQRKMLTRLGRSKKSLSRGQLLKGWTDATDAERALNSLLKKNIVTKINDRFTINKAHVELIHEGATSYIAGVEHFISAVEGVIGQRFFPSLYEQETGLQPLARTIEFDATIEALSKFSDSELNALMKKVVAMDAEASAATSSVSATMIFAVTAKPKK